MPECITAVGILIIVNSMAYGVYLGTTIGGLLNAFLATLRGGTTDHIQQAFLDGMMSGFWGGLAFGCLGAFATVYWQAQLALAGLQFAGGYYAIRTAFQDFAKGHWAAGFVSFGLGIAAAYSSAASFKAAGEMYHNSLLNKNAISNNSINPKYQRASLLERLIVRKARTGDIHPNPYDEFLIQKLDLAIQQFQSILKNIHKQEHLSRLKCKNCQVAIMKLLMDTIDGWLL